MKDRTIDDVQNYKSYRVFIGTELTYCDALSILTLPVPEARQQLINKKNT
jgi:hypothetical protein